MSGFEDPSMPLQRATAEEEAVTPPEVPPQASDSRQQRVPQNGKNSEDAGAPKKLSIRVVDQQHNEVFFQIKMNTKLSKVMGAYCQRQGLDPTSLRFLHEGDRIVDTQTPEDRDMEDGDTIEVVLPQIGGDGLEAAATSLPLARQFGGKDLEPKNVNLVIRDQHHNTFYFRIKRQTKFSKVMQAYHERKEIVEAVRFFYKGTCIQDNDTPETLNIGDGEVIQATPEQVEDSLENPNSLTIAVQDNNGLEVYFQIKSETRLETLIYAYCERQGLKKSKVGLSYRGNKVQDDDTPASLNLEDGDKIQAIVGQNSIREDVPECVTAVIRGLGYSFSLKIPTMTPLKKVIGEYCHSLTSETTPFKFFFDGFEIFDEETPEELGMNDGDIIEGCFDRVSADLALAANQTPLGLIIRVEDEDKYVVELDIYSNSSMKDLIEAYCDRLFIHRNCVQFFFNGKDIGLEDTPELLKMSSYDIINKVSVFPIWVKEKNGNEMMFQLKRTTPMKVIVDEWSSRYYLPSTDIRLLLDNLPVSDSDTFQTLGMICGDVLELYLEQATGADSNRGGRISLTNHLGEVLEASTHLGVTFCEGFNSETTSRVKKVAQSEKTINTYFKSRGQAPDNLLFALDNLCLSGPKIPESLGMQSNNIINVLPKQKVGERSKAAEEQPEENHGKLNITFREYDNQDITFRVKKCIKMEKIMTAYYTRTGRDLSSLRFYTSDGVRINNDHTPASLNLECGDTVDVHIEQLGGEEGTGTETGGNSIEIEPMDLNKALSLKILDLSGSEITFQLKMGTKMSKLIGSFCKQQGTAEDSVRFFTPSGKRILPSDTPASCELENGDVLDVQVRQQGGSLVF